MKHALAVLVLPWLLLAVASRADGPAAPAPGGGLRAEFETTKGVVEAELDAGHAPLTVMNFVGLAEGTLPFTGRPAGSRFYDGLAFHRIVPGFVAQTGDPTTADPAVPADQWGEGGPGYRFPDEFSPRLRHDAAGVVQMANAGPDTNGSQFCFMLGPAMRLNYLHNVFGRVVRGLDVIQKLERGDRIVRVTIKRPAGEPAAYRATPEAFAALEKEVVARRRAAAPAGFVYLVDETGALPEFRVNNFNYKLANYERASGCRLVVRVLREFKPERPGQRAEDALQGHAEDLQLPAEGNNVLAVCHAGPDGGWLLRPGAAVRPALADGPAGPPAAAQELARAGKLKESVDTIIDALIVRLDDFSLRAAPAPAPEPAGK